MVYPFRCALFIKLVFKENTLKIKRILRNTEKSGFFFSSGTTVLLQRQTGVFVFKCALCSTGCEDESR